jgi:tetratricopeptide (TPR) repeat protein
VHAETRALRGDLAGSRAYADTAQVEFAAQAKAAPSDAQSHILRALALAYMGRSAEAVAAGEAAILLEKQDVGYSLPYYRMILIRVLILTGRQEQAVAALEQLLAKPYYVTKAWLKVDPTFDALRDNPAFQKLIAGR